MLVSLFLFFICLLTQLVTAATSHQVALNTRGPHVANKNSLSPAATVKRVKQTVCVSASYNLGRR
jgi:hypothetical protein